MPAKTQKKTQKKDSGTYRALKKIRAFQKEIDVIRKRMTNREDTQDFYTARANNYVDSTEIVKLEKKILDTTEYDNNRLLFHRINNILFS
jgi:hypothetical protein